MSAKSDILARLRASLADAPAAPEAPREYRRESTLNADQTREMLVDRLEDYKASVHSAAVPDDLPAVLGELISGAVVLPDGFERAWLPAIDEVEDPLEAACVITSSTVSCAETGTIILTGRPEEGHRKLSLIPDHHICIVLADTIVELFPEAWGRVHDTGLEGPITMISGPSATSDIELERVEGVHGPRRLDVVILG
ncbi:LutC/YkgG family protein [Corynebacterium qintianiae]|uniref:LutC/YkgG family protein n=1 Tax=Corynebacterium qintianiae TaxID=2709392 RepID=UPI0013EAAE5A|nr:LUD domain-containing protein [Corynebacterium qintianiae]